MLSGVQFKIAGTNILYQLDLEKETVMELLTHVASVAILVAVIAAVFIIGAVALISRDKKLGQKTAGQLMREASLRRGKECRFDPAGDEEDDFPFLAA